MCIVGNIRSEHSPAIGRGSVYQRGEEEWLEETLVCVESFRAVLLQEWSIIGEEREKRGREKGRERRGEGWKGRREGYDY